MKKISFYVSLLLIALFSCPVFAGIPNVKENIYVEGEVLIVTEAPVASDYEVMGAFNENLYSWALSNQADGFARSRGLEARNIYPEIAKASGKSIIHLRSEHKSTNQLMRELSSTPSVKSVHPNYSIVKPDLIPNDYNNYNLWSMNIIKMPQVWDYITDSSSVVVAVLDSGVDYDHPDINANMAIDSYGNYGRYFNGNTVHGYPVDTLNHGTHVAGIIGAVGNNGVGVVGVSWKAKMLAVNVLASGLVTLDTDVLAGMQYVLSEKNKGLNIRVANMSFGILYPSEPIYGIALKALSDAGIICVMSAGNSNINLNTSAQKHYPACFRFANTITVGSTGPEISPLQKSGFSNYGNNYVDIAAPGEEIISTYGLYTSPWYGPMSGTSMAAPHVAGVAALLCAAYPNETAAQIKTRILNGANKNYGVSQGYWAYGTLDAWAAYYNQVEPPTIITSYVEGHHWCQIDTQIAYGSIPMTWTILNGNLPDNLELRSDGFLTGTTGACSASITLEVTNAYGSDINTIEINVMFKK